MNTNILITSAGKRVTLTQQFRETLKRFYPEAKIFTTDMNPGMAPAGIVSDGCFAVPRVTAADYICNLLKIVIGGGYWNHYSYNRYRTRGFGGK